MTTLVLRTLQTALIFAIVLAPRVAVSQDKTPRLKGSWSATVGAGQILQGSWTAQLDPAKADIAVGSWTLLGPGSQIAAQGTWSAIKSERTWSGTWQARVTGNNRLLAGSWRTQVAQSGLKSLADLFQHTLQDAVSGTWAGAGTSGAWTIRAYP